MHFELSIFNSLHGLVDLSSLLNWLFIFFAQYLGYFLIIGFLVILFLEKDWRQRLYYSSFAVLSVVLSRGILTETIRFFFDRSRPFVVLNFEPLVSHAVTPALPSGHAAFYFALALAVLLINKKWGLIYLGFASLMGIARVIVGVHWPLDILAGALVAIVSFFVVKWLLVRR